MISVLRFSSLCSAAVLLTLVACVSQSTGGPGPGTSVDAGTFDATVAGDDAGVTSPMTDASVTCNDQPLADGACNALTNVDTTAVTGTCPGGAQPVGTGGTVVDGTYVLTAQARYVDAGCTPTTFQAAMVIQGSCSERVDGLTGGATLARDGTFATSGNVLTRTATCGTGLPAATYTATATEITIFDQGGSVTTWTKQ